MLDSRYQTFALLTKNKSYTQTAKDLFITQPAVSQQIKSLENELQLKLVEYHHPHLQITDAGLQLAQFIATTQHQEDKLINTLRHPNLTADLKFGVTLSVSIFMAPTLIQKWQPLFNQIHCTVSNTRTILDLIDAGKIDFAILEGNFDKNRYGHKIVSQEDFVAITRVQNPVLQKPSLTLADLVNEPLLLREKGSGTRSIFIEWASSFNINQQDFAQVIELGSSTGIINLLESTGISFMYRSLVEEQLASYKLALLDIKGLDITRPISLVYAKNSYFEENYQQLF